MTETPTGMQKPKTGYIYVIGAAGMQAVKIGYAANVEARLSGLQTGSPFPLTVLWQQMVSDAKSAEDALHKRFRDKRIRGEWFDLGPDAVRIVREACNTVAPVPFSRRFTSDAEGEDAVLSVFREADRAVTSQYIAAKTGARWPDVRAVLARLVRQGQVKAAADSSYSITETTARPWNEPLDTDSSEKEQPQ